MGIASSLCSSLVSAYAQSPSQTQTPTRGARISHASTSMNVLKPTTHTLPRTNVADPLETNIHSGTSNAVDTDGNGDSGMDDGNTRSCVRDLSKSFAADCGTDVAPTNEKNDKINIKVHTTTLPDTLAVAKTKTEHATAVTGSLEKRQRKLKSPDDVTNNKTTGTKGEVSAPASVSPFAPFASSLVNHILLMSVEVCRYAQIQISVLILDPYIQ